MKAGMLRIDVLVFSLLVLGMVQAQEKTAPPAKEQAAPQDRMEDRDAIRASVKSLVDAFERRDAAKVVSLLTEGAELDALDSPPIHGRKSILESLQKHFEKKQKQNMVLEAESLRFISRDTATEEGIVKTSQNNQAWATHRYTLMHVREDGKWLIASIREQPSDDAPLRDLEWLIGSWQAQRDDLAINANYDWVGNKAFIRGNITTRQKDRAISAMQVIGLDPKSGTLRIWIFEANGIYAEGACQRDENSWVFHTSGEAPDGTSVASKNILYYVNADTLTWQPVELRRGQEQIADLPPIKVTRIKK